MIKTYDHLIQNLEGLLWLAKDEGRLNDPEDIETLEFVLSWFEANSEDVREFLEGDN